MLPIPRLLYVVADDHYFVTHMLGLAMASKAAGYDVHVACPNGVMVDGLADAGLAVHALGPTPSRFQPIDAIRMMRRLVMLYQNLRPDCVHHVGLPLMISGSLAAFWTGVPRVVNALTGVRPLFDHAKWSLPPMFCRLLLHMLLRPRRSVLIAQTPEDQADLAALSKSPVRMILGSGVDANHFAPSSEAPPESPIVITHASRLLWSKGIAELVLASRLLQSEGYAIQVQIAGVPDLTHPDAVPAEQLQAWHDEGVITWLGTQEDMAPIYQQSHIAILASYYPEGIPKTLVEAAAVGLPIVTTDMPGCRIIVKDRANGLLVEPRNGYALARALEELILKPQLRATLGAKGRERVLAHFEAKLIYAKTIECYKAAPAC